MVKPSEYLTAILSGELHPADTPAAIQSWLQFICYRIAVDLQSLTREQQRERAREYPDAVLDIIRTWYKVAQKKPALAGSLTTCKVSLPTPPNTSVH